MEDFVAYPSRWRIVLLILGALAFVAIGFLMIGAFGEPPRSDRYSPIMMSAIGWSAIIFFGLCAFAAGKRLFETGEELRIGRNGIQCRRWSDELIPWSAISDVTIWSTRGQRFIILHLFDPPSFPRRRGALGKLAVANRVLTGGDVCISLTTTDRSFGEAMAAIEQWRPRSAY